MSAAERGMQLGPFLLTSVADCAMFGAICAMLSYGASTYMKYESNWVRCLVIWLGCLAVIDTGYIGAWTWLNFVKEFGIFENGAIWFSWFYIIGALFRVPTLIFFGERAWRLIQRNMFFAVALGICCLGCLVGGIGVRVTGSVPTQGLRGDVDREDVFIFTYLSSEMAADIGITSTMLFKLLNSRTGWQNTDRTLFRVARIVAETQLPPTVFTAVLMSFVAADAVGKTNTITAFFLCSHKVYVLCVLSVLTIRHNMREQDDLTSAASMSGVFASKTRPTGKRVPPQIYVHTEVETHATPSDPHRRAAAVDPEALQSADARSPRTITFEDNEDEMFPDRKRPIEDMRSFLDDGPEGQKRAWKPLKTMGSEM